MTYLFILTGRTFKERVCGVHSLNKVKITGKKNLTNLHNINCIKTMFWVLG